MGIVIEKIVVAGPVIVRRGKVLLVRDDEDEFYKFPGGQVEPGETKEEACRREVMQEIGGIITIRQKLSTQYLNKNPQTGESMRIELHHYLSELNNPSKIEPIPPIQEAVWLDIKDIKRGEYKVAPNVLYLIKRGQIR